MIRIMFIDPKPFTNHLFTVNFSLDICVVQKKARQEKLAKIKSLKRQKAKPSELTLTQMVGGADKDTNTEVILINLSFFKILLLESFNPAMFFWVYLKVHYLE